MQRQRIRGDGWRVIYPLEHHRTERVPRKQVSTAEATFASWVRTALLGIALGLAVAKYSQALVGEAVHGGATMGAVMVVISVALTLMTAFRSQQAGVPSGIVLLGASLIGLFGWVALAIIIFAGPDLPTT